MQGQPIHFTQQKSLVGYIFQNCYLSVFDQRVVFTHPNYPKRRDDEQY